MCDYVITLVPRHINHCHRNHDLQIGRFAYNDNTVIKQGSYPSYKSSPASSLRNLTPILSCCNSQSAWQRRPSSNMSDASLIRETRISVDPDFNGLVVQGFLCGMDIALSVCWFLES